MTDVAVTKAKIAQAAGDLDIALRALNHALMTHAGDWPCVTYDVPVIEPAEEPAYRQVSRLTGASARDAARAIFAAIDYTPGQHPVLVRRRPGVWLAPAELIGPIEAANAAKDTLKACVAELPRGRWARERATMSRARSLCLVQAYRHIRLQEEGASRVSLGWDAHGAGGRRITVADARKRIGEPGYYGEISDARIEIERAALDGLPSDEIVLQRKPVAMSPSANIWQVPRATPRHCRIDMPLVVIADAPDTPIEIRDLKDFDPAVEPRATRSDRRTEDEPLIERLKLFRYRPHYRQRRASLPVDGSLAFEDNCLVLDMAGGRSTLRSPRIEVLAAAVATLLSDGTHQQLQTADGILELRPDTRVSAAVRMHSRVRGTSDEARVALRALRALVAGSCAPRRDA